MQEAFIGGSRGGEQSCLSREAEMKGSGVPAGLLPSLQFSPHLMCHMEKPYSFYWEHSACMLTVSCNYSLRIAWLFLLNTYCWIKHAILEEVVFEQSYNMCHNYGGLVRVKKLQYDGLRQIGSHTQIHKTESIEQHNANLVSQRVC